MIAKEPSVIGDQFSIMIGVVIVNAGLNVTAFVQTLFVPRIEQVAEPLLQQLNPAPHPLEVSLVAFHATVIVVVDPRWT